MDLAVSAGRGGWCSRNETGNFIGTQVAQSVTQDMSLALCVGEVPQKKKKKIREERNKKISS